MQKDFSFVLKIDDLSQSKHHYHLSAGEHQLKELASILKVEDVKSFTADIDLKLSRKIHRLDIEGKVTALLELKSVISLENFEKLYEVPFKYYYDTSMSYQDLRDLDLSIDDEAPEIIENGQIDLGQIAIEQLALVMEDYPRQVGEYFDFDTEFDEDTTGRTNPFAVLKKLKK